MSIGHLERTGGLHVASVRPDASPGAFLFPATKRLFDIAFSLVLLPGILVVGVILICLNPFFNKGSLLFVQTRMGRDCKPFKAYKFRSMRASEQITRSATCPLETDRITPLGRILRKSRFDELPQILNVLFGDMSLIGPRPDAFEHAQEYLKSIPNYHKRHVVRPGISGLAQTQLGYIEGIAATRRKVQADLIYIDRAGFRLEAWVFWRTLAVVVGRRGA